jgi:hypothetical protein
MIESREWLECRLSVSSELRSITHEQMSKKYDLNLPRKQTKDSDYTSTHSVSKTEEKKSKMSTNEVRWGDERSRERASVLSYKDSEGRKKERNPATSRCAFLDTPRERKRERQDGKVKGSGRVGDGDGGSDKRKSRLEGKKKGRAVGTQQPIGMK